MKPARIIWIIWCLAWVLIWCLLFLRGAASWGACERIAGAAACGSRRDVYFWLLPAALSGAAIWLPVGTGETWRAWWARYSPSQLVDAAGEQDH